MLCHCCLVIRTKDRLTWPMLCHCCLVIRTKVRLTWPMLCHCCLVIGRVRDATLTVFYSTWQLPTLEAVFSAFLCARVHLHACNVEQCTHGMHVHYTTSIVCIFTTHNCTIDTLNSEHWVPIFCACRRPVLLLMCICWRPVSWHYRSYNPQYRLGSTSIFITGQFYSSYSSPTHNNWYALVTLVTNGRTLESITRWFWTALHESPAVIISCDGIRIKCACPHSDQWHACARNMGNRKRIYWFNNAAGTVSVIRCYPMCEQTSLLV